MRTKMNNWKPLLFISMLGLFASQKAQATHLIGGELGYEQIGETSLGSGMYRYRVYMNFYLNCGNNSNFSSLLQFLMGGPLNSTSRGNLYTRP